MADFQSTLTAQEIEKVLTGAVLFNSNTKLSEAQKAQARANIGATPYGEGIKIVSHFDTVEELKSMVAQPMPGDAYSVGSKLPYNLYIYDSLASEWKDYGAIRSTDISARFAQNKSVAVADWEEDTNVFVDYSYKAKIPVGEVTGNDFPIVAFSPFDATSGNFCPIAYCFDGYVEVWAKTKPTATISIPAITFIVQEGGATGNSAKGITNACGGTPTGGVTTALLAKQSVTAEKIAPGAVSLKVTTTIPTEGWTEYVNYAVNSFTVEGLVATDNPIVDLDLTGKTGEELVALTEEWGNILRAGVDSTGKFYVYFSDIPTTAIPIKIMVVRK